MDNQLRNRVPGPTGPFMLRPTAVLVGTLLLAACETTVSLEEARQITASFEGFSYTPPPKTISDVVSLLDQQKPADPKAVEKARKTATREPPLSSPLKKAPLTGFHPTAKHTAAKAISPSSETMRTI